jgi:hypothetical protein
MRWVLIVIGVLMLLIGGLWTLQGINVLPGSFMSGQSFWATIGLLLLIGGALLCYFGWRRGMARPDL